MSDAAKDASGLEPEPEVAATSFGDRIDLAREFTAALAEQGIGAD